MSGKIDLASDLTQKKKTFRVPLLVLVKALLPETLQFLKIAKRPDIMVEPADTFNIPLLALKLHRLAPKMKEMLPPQTWNNFVMRNDNTQSNFTLTNTPWENVEDDKAELSDVETFATCRWQLMQRVTRDIALDKPNGMNDQA